MRNSKGFILISAIFLMTAAILVLAFVAGIMREQLMRTSDSELKLKSFWAAEGGVEWAKAKLVENPSWYTDPPHSPSDDDAWILNEAAGFHLAVRDIRVKIIREENKSFLYAVGYVGRDVGSAKAVSMIKIKFQTAPFEQLSWSNF